jgi:hypothetical protein
MRSLAEQRLNPQIHLPAHQEVDSLRPGPEPEGIRAMTFRSVLFENPQDSLQRETPEAPGFFSDLNLDQIIDAVAAGRQEYNLKPFFYTALNDVDTIKYRQEVARDLENETLLACIKSFAQKMIVMRRYLAMLEKLHYKYHKEGCNEGSNFILRKPHADNRRGMQRIFAKKPPVYSFSIHPRDEAGGRFLSELKDRGINLVANALAQSADHIESFFKMLRIELAFYIGCLNLYEQLVRMGEPVSFPLPAAAGERRHSFRGLYDVCLALTMQQKIVGNDVNADNKELVIITGANQGGKSTFLRSIGLAQLMMQCGMFAPAESFSANICSALFTHYKREEDAGMESGKLDEELGRMSDIVDNITPDSMVLFNESFAATNEREGSEIARQIVCALLEKRIKEFFVTHLYEFPQGIYEHKMENVIFLRADRKADGKRTFKLIEDVPLQTSFGEDLHQRVFGTDN